jgi:Tol biopolymer transport system component
MWVKALVVAVLALCGATTAWTAVGGRTATAPISGVRPVWSPDGRQIAFADIVGATVSGSWGIFVVDADGSGRRQLTRGSLFTPHGISWSADGKTLAFDAFMSGGPTSVYTVPVAGGNAAKVTSGWSPTWAPGNKLVVTDESEGQFGRDVRLYSVNLDGTDRQTFVQCPEIDFDQPCGDGDAVFSADAKKIAFDNNLFGSASAVYTMNADGSGRRQITPYSPPSTLPQWGPNASALVYDRIDLSGDTTKDSIHVVNADGTGDNELVKNAHEPSWSPDGKTILFTRSEGAAQTLYAMNADGSNVHAFTGPSGTTTTTTTPAGARCLVPKVVGKTLANAKKLLAKAHCKAGKVTKVRSAKVRAGLVVSANPKVGRSLVAGSAVALSVSRGNK